MIAGDIESNGALYIKTACIDSDVSCYGLFKFAPSFKINKSKKYTKIIYYISIKKITNKDYSKNMTGLISILLIYFCQFYIILFDKMLAFNFDNVRYGKCIFQDYIIKENWELQSIEDIEVNIDISEKYYKNYYNDSYFDDPKNNKINLGRNVEIVPNSLNKNIVQGIGREKLPPMNPTTIRINSTLKNNN